MIATIWNGEDILLLIVCVVAIVLALAFFISIYVADATDAKRRAEAKRAFRRARKHFAPNPRPLHGDKEVHK